jgi:hypothetical protein
VKGIVTLRNRVRRLILNYPHCTENMYKFNMSFVFHIYILGSMSWIWTSPSTERLKFESPSKWNSYEGFNLEQWWHICLLARGPADIAQDWSLQCPSKYTSPKTTLQNATPKWKWRRHLKSSIQYACHKNQQAKGTVTTRNKVGWLILNSPHCTRNMYHLIHARV